MDVISKLGAPTDSIHDSGNSCDVYRLYTTGRNGAKKAAVILGEAGADLFTAGLFEIVATPAEAVTKDKRHTVLVCYSADDSLVSIRDEGKAIEDGRARAVEGPSASNPPPEAKP